MTNIPSYHPVSPFGPDVWDVLARYVAGESPAPEAKAVRQWLAEDPRRAELLATLEQTIGSLAVRPAADVDVEAAWRRVSARIREPEVRVLPFRRRWGTIGLQAAAALALVIGATAVWRTMNQGEGTTVATARVISTRPGQTDSVRLSDGTRVVVGPGSEVIVAAGYGGTTRTVELKGEALFDVVHDVRPFTVRAGQTLIEDIGTTFTVRNDEDQVVRVVVTSGAVRLQGMVLNQGDRGTVGADGVPVAQRAAATEDDLAWTQGRLVFDDAPLARVRAGIRRWYGVELVADSALAGRHLTATFSGEPIAQVLDVVGLALGARVERRGDTAVVRAR